MGRLLLHADGRLRAVPLAAVSTLGRHWSCHARLSDPVVPMFWLEVRWRGEAGWCWRELSVLDTTYGPGTPVDAGWRPWVVRGGRGARVRGPGDTWAELTDAAPPALVLTDTAGGEFLEGADVEELVEVRPDGVRDPGEHPPRLLRDGDILVAGRRAWRVHVPLVPMDTVRSWVDVSDDACDLDVSRDTLSASFTTPRGCVVVRGECVRVLLVYARARVHEPPEDGWLPSVDAHAEWVALGGNPDSVVERLSWERGKLRTALSRSGAIGVDAIFERRTWRGTPEFRLAISRARVRLA